MNIAIYMSNKNNNTAKAGKNNNNKNTSAQKEPVKLCFSCAQPGHIRKNCPVSTQPVPRAQAKAVNKKAAQPFVKAETFASKKVASAISKDTGERIASANTPSGARAGTRKPRTALQQASALASVHSSNWELLHEGVRQVGTDVRHGKLERAFTQTEEGQECHLRGEELVAIVRTTDAVPPGHMMSLPLGINPQEIGVRLPIESLSYGKFVATKLTFCYVPAISVATPGSDGQLFMGYNADPSAELPPADTTELPKAATTWERNYEPFRTTEHAELKTKLDLATQMPLFTQSSEDQRFDEQGLFVVGSVTGIAANKECGVVYLKYEITCSQPNLPETPQFSVYGYGGVPSAAADNDFFAGLTKWTGKRLNIVDASEYGGSLLLDQGKSYDIVVTQFASPSQNISAGLSLTPLPGKGTVADFTLTTGVPWRENLPQPTFATAGNSTSEFRIVNGDGTALTAGMAIYRWTFSVVGAAVVFSLQGATSAATPLETTFSISESPTAVMVYRDVPGASFLSVADEVALRSMKMGERVAAAMRELCEKEIAVCPPQDSRALNYCLEAFGSNQRVTGAATGAFVVGPMLAEAAKFLLAHFGAKIAAHLLKIGIKKLEEYARK